MAGGLKDVTLGDVVGATKVYNYASGKDRERFEPRPDLGLSSYELVQRARAEPTQGRLAHSRPRRSARAAAEGACRADCRRRAGGYVAALRHGSTTAGSEMEGRGLLQTAHANAQVRAIVIRGVSDVLARERAADAAGSQQRASDHAAAYAFQVLARLPCTEMNHMRVIEDAEDAGSTVELAAGSGIVSPLLVKAERLISNLLEAG